MLAKFRPFCHLGNVSAKTLAVLLVRIAGLLCLLGGIFLLVADVLASWGKVGLVYWRTFVTTVVIPPILGSLFGLILLLLSKPLGFLLVGGLEDLRAPGRESSSESSPKPRFRTGDRAGRRGSSGEE